MHQHDHHSLTVAHSQLGDEGADTGVSGITAIMAGQPADGEHEPAADVGKFADSTADGQNTEALAAISDEAPSTWNLMVLALEFIGGAPRLIVPDQARALVKMPGRYDPELGHAYEEFARHYGCAVLPARSAHPRAKLKVEPGATLDPDVPAQSPDLQPGRVEPGHCRVAGRSEPVAMFQSGLVRAHSPSTFSHAALMTD